MSSQRGRRNAEDATRGGIVPEFGVPAFDVGRQPKPVDPVPLQQPWRQHIREVKAVGIKSWLARLHVVTTM